MTDQPERQRLMPTRAGRVRLLADLDALQQAHVVDAGALGEYAQVLMANGPASADALLPDVAAHLEAGCADCDADLDALVEMLDEPEPPPAPRSTPPGPGPSAALPMEQSGAVAGMPPTYPVPALNRSPEREQPADLDDSGIFVAHLPDARAVEAEAARRHRLRRIRDLLLIAAAVSVLLLGLSLVGLAYLSRQAQEPVRVPLMPQPGGAPSQSVAPFLQPGAVGQPAGATNQGAVSGARAVPEGMNCPPSHPVKGNRESRIYHLPGGMSYGATRPEVCYATAADAEADGYRRSQR